MKLVTRFVVGGLLLVVALGTGDHPGGGESVGAEAKTQTEIKNGLEVIAPKADSVMDVEVGELVKLTIPIKNVSHDDIHVDKVMSKSCGCVQGTLSPAKLAPGQQGELILEPDTKGARAGVTRLSLLARTTDSKIVGIAGTVDYMVRQDIAFTPSAVDLGDLRPGQSYEALVEATTMGSIAPERVHVVGVEEGVRAIIEPTVVGNTRPVNASGPHKYAIRLSGKAPTAEGVFSAMTRVEFAPLAGKSRVFGVAMKGRVVGPITVSPGQLMLGVIRQHQVIEKQLVLRPRSGETITVRNAA
jgi:hypothetical protein